MKRRRSLFDIKKSEYDKIRYHRKIKPLRKTKIPHFYHSIKCPMCSRRSFMRNLKYPIDFNVSLVGFAGKKAIIWKRNQYDKEQYLTIWNSLRKRIIKLVDFFGITPEELNIKFPLNYEFNEIHKSPREISNFNKIHKFSEVKQWQKK